MSSQNRKFLQQCMDQFQNSFGSCIARPHSEVETSPDECAQTNDVATADGSNLRLQPAIFRLNFDCLQELFGWLSLEDLVAFGKTCTWLRHNVGQWWYEKRPQLRIFWQQNKVYALEWPPDWYAEIDCFSQFIRHITVSYPLSKDASYLHVNRYQSLKTIEFKRIKIKIAPVEIGCLKEILGQVETIKFNDCRIDVNPYEAILSACKNMTYLSLIGKLGKKTSKIIGTSNGWLREKYPKLEHFELKYDYIKVKKIKELPQFLDLNSRIRSFSTDVNYFLKNFEYFLGAKTKLDVFSITILYAHREDYLRECIPLLNQLHENEFYKQLHCNYSTLFFHHGDVDLLASLVALIKLEIEYVFSELILIPDLAELEELFFPCAYDVANWVELPDRLVNLRRMRCQFASADDVFIFIGRSPSANRITVNNLSGGIHFNNDTRVLDLVALNNERKKLKHAQKITIFLREEIYLATKWAFNETNFSLIQLKSIFYMQDEDIF